MGKKARTFSLHNMTVVFYTHVITGFQKGEAVTIAAENEHWTLVEGTHGEALWVLNPSASANITIRLGQGNPLNKVLGDLERDDYENITGPYMFKLKDNLGEARVTCPDTRILKHADMSFGTEGSGREWSCKGAHVDMKDGANE